MFDQNDNLEKLGFSGMADDEPDLIPLLSTEDEEQINSEKIPSRPRLKPCLCVWGEDA